MKVYKLKDKYVGFRISKNDNRFHKDLSQGEAELLYNSGFKKFFDVIEQESEYGKAKKNADKYTLKKEVEGETLEVKAVKPRRTRKKADK